MARAAILVFSGALLLSAQAPREVVIQTHPYTPPSAILHAESNLVETEVTVRDANGRGVPGLRASDFQVFDNGVAQTIAAFSENRRNANQTAPPAAPKFVTFFFDDLHPALFPGSPFMASLDLPFVKQAARNVAARFLKPGDRISITTASGAKSLDFTNGPATFIAASDRLNFHAHIVRSIEEYLADSVSTLDALTGAAARLSSMPGQRILVFVSSGFVIYVGTGRDAEPDVQKLIDAAVRWNVTIDSIDAKGLSADPNTWRSNRPLREIAQGTGGHFFENSNDLTGAMQLAANPEVTYLIAFNPGPPDGKFHTLKFRFTSKRAGSLEFRPGYLARKDDAAEKRLAARAPLDDAVFSKQNLDEVPAAITLSGGRPKDGAIPVSIKVDVDVSRLAFASSHGRHMQQLVFLMTLLDSKGEFVTGKESIMELALTDDKLASLKKTGLKTVATLTAPPGIYQARTIVREGMKGNLTASTAYVELRAK